MIQVKNARKITFNNPKSVCHGFVTLEAEGLTLTDVKLIEANGKFFLSYPSKKGKDKEGNEKYYDIGYVSKEVYQDVLNRVMMALGLNVANQSVEQNTSSTPEYTQQPPTDVAF